jgi:hypothetical protein
MTERYRPKHLNSSEYGFLASVGSDRGRKIAAHADSIADHADRASAVDAKPTVTDDDHAWEDDDPSAIDDARRGVESKSRAVERGARSRELTHARGVIAKKQKAEAARRTIPA